MLNFLRTSQKMNGVIDTENCLIMNIALVHFVHFSFR